MLELSNVHKVYKVGAFGGDRLQALRVDLVVRGEELVHELAGEQSSGACDAHAITSPENATSLAP